MWDFILLSPPPRWRLFVSKITKIKLWTGFNDIFRKFWWWANSAVFFPKFNYVHVYPCSYIRITRNKSYGMNRLLIKNRAPWNKTTEHDGENRKQNYCSHIKQKQLYLRLHQDLPSLTCNKGRLPVLITDQLLWGHSSQLQIHHVLVDLQDAHTEVIGPFG